MDMNFFNFFSSKEEKDGLDPNRKLSPNFKLGEFLKSDSYPNVRNIPEEYQIDNLQNLAERLELLRKLFGPIKIESGFRSQELNSALSGGNAQVSSTSYHMQGLAADISFLKTKVQKVVAYLAAHPDLAKQFGEIAVKYNYIHISAPTPRKTAYFMYVDTANRYIKMSNQQIKDFITRWSPSPAVAGGMAAAIIALAGGSFLFYQLYKRRSA